MIKTIRHKGLAELFYDDQRRRLPQEQIKRLRQILSLLDSATTIEDMNAPGLKLHALKGDYAGFYAVSVTGNWRVVFRFVNGNAEDIDYVDYH